MAALVKHRFMALTQFKGSPWTLNSIMGDIGKKVRRLYLNRRLALLKDSNKHKKKQWQPKQKKAKKLSVKVRLVFV
jgi:hypothetical protein